ncbi:MAG: DUF6478 family protein [Paracoccaceae bacterium]
MGRDGNRLWDKMFDRRVMRRWNKVAQQANTANFSALKRDRTRAKILRGYLDRVIFQADDRLTMVQQSRNLRTVPHTTDWDWDPDLWRGALSVPGYANAENASKLCDDVTLFHDCPLREITLRQVRNKNVDVCAPFGLNLEVFDFKGTFLSVVIDLPLSVIQGLSRAHIIRMDTLVQLERPMKIHARLNVKNGPNADQVMVEMDLQGDTHSAEFDLAYAGLNEKRMEKAWVDLFFEQPAMNHVTLQDMTFSRHLRAAL